MSRHHIVFTVASILVLFTSALALAAEPPACGKLPKDIVDSGRNFRVCITGPATPGINCGPTGFDIQIFDNDEKKLPKARNGQTYYEGKIRDPGAPAGEKRWVDLSTDGDKPKVLAEYYSSDHYVTFCTYKSK